jgi:hypothetical protein
MEPEDTSLFGGSNSCYLFRYEMKKYFPEIIAQDFDD